MVSKRLKSLAARFIEAILAVVLVLAFFLVVLGLLNTFFPSGSSFKELVKQQGRFPPTQSVRDLLLSPDGERLALTDQSSLTAVLIRKRNEVKSKRSDGIAWTGAHEGMPLRDRDAVQTFQRASATISFDEQNRLDMGENSLVIIQRLEQDTLLREKRSFMIMVEGELRGRIAESDEKSVHVEVATPTAVARIRSLRSPDGQAEFKITVNPDKSSTVAIYHGVAEVIAQGETVHVQANQAATVNPDEPPMPPQPLPDPPALATPADSSLFYYQDLSPRIRFKWSAPANVEGYRFILARDSHFHDIVYEEKLSQPTFIHGNLKNGDYYWRVSSLEGWREGTFGEAWQLKVVQDREPPMLRIEFPPETVNRDRYVLEGQTEPGARVFVRGEQVTTSETGEFEYPLKLRHGINVIVVEAVDKVGNVSYRSQLVNGKF